MSSTKEETIHNRFVNNLIEQQNWDELEAYVQQNPQIAHDTIRSGGTLLHCITSVGSTPPQLIRTVASANPQAIGTPDQQYQDLPVHFVCRNLQTSAIKLRVLLEYCTSPDMLLKRNQFGGTPLHSACNHNAVFEALQALVEATHGQILKVRTFQGHHCVTTLWQSYTSTIAGHMCVANLQKDTAVLEQLPRHFQMFWAKCQYLALQSYSTQDTRHLFHALLRCNVPIQLYKTAILLISEDAFITPDSNGNLPLHWMLENRPYQFHEHGAIQALLHHHSAAASARNAQGDWPLLIAIRNKIPWHVGIRPVLEAYPSAIHCRTNDGWLPFQLAALIGGKRSLETIFQLLLVQPDLLLCTTT